MSIQKKSYLVSFAKPWNVWWNAVIAFMFASMAMIASQSLAQDPTLITKSDVEKLLARASMATSSQDAIIAVVDRTGRILGVRVEAAVEAAYAGREQDLVFAIDGAVAKARTAAFFSNSMAHLTSRTIRFISQSSITQREVESNPNLTDPQSPIRGPGFVAPIGIAGRFPPEVINTPLVDLFAIEHQSRDSKIHPGLDQTKGTADDVVLANRFDAQLANIPNVPAKRDYMAADGFPESYGFQSQRFMNAQSRGIATLPGGIGLYKTTNGVPKLVGGIGVFFPGPMGYAATEQGFVHAAMRGAAGPQTEASRTNAPKVLEAEFMAFFASGGTKFGERSLITSVEEFEGLAPRLDAYGGPAGRIDLVGITLEIYGPNPTRANPIPGQQTLLRVGRAFGNGRGANSGSNQIVAPAELFLDGKEVPQDFLILPHDAPDGSLTAAEVFGIIVNGAREATVTRAAIRLDVANGFKPGARTSMVFAVSDKNGEILGLYRMPDATVFSIDVAVAKARNTAYYASNFLEAADAVDANNDNVADVPRNVAFTNRTFRFLTGPNFPTGATAGPPGDFSILNMPGINSRTAENSVLSQPWPYSVYAGTYPGIPATVMSFNSFNRSRNFRDPRAIQRQNGVVFFPGSTPLYNPRVGNQLVGGFGVSGDGVDQDDVVTVAGQQGFAAPPQIRCDNFSVSGVRLPFQKFNRNPGG